MTRQNYVENSQHLLGGWPTLAKARLLLLIKVCRDPQFTLTKALKMYPSVWYACFWLPVCTQQHSIIRLRDTYVADTVARYLLSYPIQKESNVKKSSASFLNKNLNSVIFTQTIKKIIINLNYINY